ncbi:aminoglycoside 3-N-acetyltransferase [Ornithinibacter aureus]|uniref:Aminoglycoside N(3)-acetyltransferase n=2 Tax=Ornithinibacter aureus TaxID=622664 RepID=A0ABP8JJJ8_9MICO
MVHASLRAIGPVEEGAVGVVRALERAVGSTGTLLFLLGARDDLSWVNARPEPERADLLAAAAPFDKDATPADPEVGVLAEVFRQLPGTVVNDHPDARFGARGRQARALLAEPLPWDDYYGRGSILERFVRARGKVLRLGADSNTVTLLHLAENRVDLPTKRRVLRHHKVLTSSGTPRIRTVTCLDDTDGILDWPGEDYFTTILQDYLHHRAARLGTVGAAHSELIEAGDLLDHAVAWMHAHFSPD